MFSAMLFAISIVALGQFALYYWRALVTGEAAQPICRDVLEAIQVEERDLAGADFEKLASLLVLTPELDRSRQGLGLVPAYFRLVGKLSDYLGGLFPRLVMWSQHEQVLCARFAAVRVGRRLQANLEQAAAMRSC
jgi:hypothetical protein